VGFDKGVVAKLVLKLGTEDVNQAITLISLGMVRALGTELTVDVPVAVVGCQIAPSILQLHDQYAIMGDDNQIELHRALRVADQDGSIRVP